MRDIDELPEFTPAGRRNLLLHVAGLSTACYIEAPIEKPAFPAFVWGLVIGAAVSIPVAWATWGV